MEKAIKRCWDKDERQISSLFSDRLELRRFDLSDADSVAALAGDARIARMTEVVPHPYKVEDAISWIAGQSDSYSNGHGPTWAVCRKDTSELIGSIGIVIRRRNRVGLLGYWTGAPFWGQGFTREAASVVVEWARAQQIPRLSAIVLADNVPSRKILLRLGFLEEGILKSEALRDGKRIDVHCYGLVFG